MTHDDINKYPFTSF